MSLFFDEIHEQPQALRRLLEAEVVSIRQVAQAIRRRAPRFVVMAARGSSDNAARYGQYLFGARNRLPVALATPSLFTLYKTPPRLKDALVLAISQSGQSPDICAVVDEGRRQGAMTVAVTNDPESPLAALAEACIHLHAGPERAIAASKTYTASLLALAMLSCALEDDLPSRSLNRVPGAAKRTLQHAQTVLSAAAAYAQADACVTIGRGYNYATAFEIALKLKELAYLLAEPYSSADFQHGPVALVQDGFLVIAVVPAGRVAAELTRFLEGLRQRGARLVVIASHPRPLALAHTPIPLPAGLPEWLSPITAVISGQLFALGLTQARGLDPDRPRGLSKITRTR